MPTMPTGPSGRAAQTMNTVSAQFQQREQAIAAREQQKQQFLQQQQMKQQEMQQSVDMQQLELQLRQQQAEQSREAKRQQFEFNSAAKNIELAGEYGERIETVASKDGGPVSFKSIKTDGKTSKSIASKQEFTNRMNLIQTTWPEFAQRDPERAQALAKSKVPASQIESNLRKQQADEKMQDVGAQDLAMKWPDRDPQEIANLFHSGYTHEEIEERFRKKAEKEQKDEDRELISSGGGSPQDQDMARMRLGWQPNERPEMLKYKIAKDLADSLMSDPPLVADKLLPALKRAQKERDLAFEWGDNDVVEEKEREITRLQKAVDEARKEKLGPIEALGPALELLLNYSAGGLAEMGQKPEIPQKNYSDEEQERQGELSDEEVRMRQQSSEGAIPESEQGIPSGPPQSDEGEFGGGFGEEEEKPAVDHKFVSSMVQNVMNQDPDTMLATMEAIYQSANEGDPESRAALDQFKQHLIKGRDQDVIEVIKNLDPRIRSEVLFSLRESEEAGDADATRKLNILKEFGMAPSLSPGVMPGGTGVEHLKYTKAGLMGESGDFNPKTGRRWGKAGESFDKIGGRTPEQLAELVVRSYGGAGSLGGKESLEVSRAKKSLDQPKYKEFKKKFDELMARYDKIYAKKRAENG